MKSKPKHQVPISFNLFQGKGLLGSDLLLSPPWQASVTLNGQSITAVSAAKATDTGTEAAEGVLRCLRLLHGLGEGPLGKDRKTHGTRVLSTRVQVGGGKETADRGSTGLTR